MKQLEKVLIAGAKIYGGIAKVVGTCVIFYTLLCAITAAKQYNDSKHCQQIKEENEELSNFREKLTIIAEQNASDDRGRIAQMHTKSSSKTETKSLAS